MATVPNVPNDSVPAEGGFNPASEDFPALDPIKVIDLVGPSAANRQPKALAKRDDTIVEVLNPTVVSLNYMAGYDSAGDPVFPGSAGPIFLCRDGSLPWAGEDPLNMSPDGGTTKYAIINLADGVDPQDAVTKAQLDSATASLTNKLNRDGTNTWSGVAPLKMSADEGTTKAQIKQMADGTDLQDAVTLRQLLGQGVGSTFLRTFNKGLINPANTDSTGWNPDTDWAMEIPVDADNARYIIEHELHHVQAGSGGGKDGRALFDYDKDSASITGVGVFNSTDNAAAFKADEFGAVVLNQTAQLVLDIYVTSDVRGSGGSLVSSTANRLQVWARLSPDEQAIYMTPRWLDDAAHVGAVDGYWRVIGYTPAGGGTGATDFQTGLIDIDATDSANPWAGEPNAPAFTVTLAENADLYTIRFKGAVVRVASAEEEGCTLVLRYNKANAQLTGVGQLHVSEVPDYNSNEIGSPVVVTTNWQLALLVTGNTTGPGSTTGMSGDPAQFELWVRRDAGNDNLEFGMLLKLSGGSHYGAIDGHWDATGAATDEEEPSGAVAILGRTGQLYIPIPQTVNPIESEITVQSAENLTGLVNLTPFEGLNDYSPADANYGWMWQTDQGIVRVVDGTSILSTAGSGGAIQHVRYGIKLFNVSSTTFITFRVRTERGPESVIAALIAMVAELIRGATAPNHVPMLADGSGPVPAWVTTTSYTAGDQVVSDGKLYVATTTGTSGGTAPTHTSDGHPNVLQNQYATESDGGVSWRFVAFL